MYLLPLCYVNSVLSLILTLCYPMKFCTWSLATKKWEAFLFSLNYITPKRCKWVAYTVGYLWEMRQIKRKYHSQRIPSCENPERHGTLWNCGFHSYFDTGSIRYLEFKFISICHWIIILLNFISINSSTPLRDFVCFSSISTFLSFHSRLLSSLFYLRLFTRCLDAPSDNRVSHSITFIFMSFSLFIFPFFIVLLALHYILHLFLDLSRWIKLMGRTRPDFHLYPIDFHLPPIRIAYGYFLIFL